MSFASKHRTVVLLGASFSTGNLGVSALAWSSIRLIITTWPDATVVLLGGRQLGSDTILIEGRQLVISTYPVRYSPSLLAHNHIVKILFGMMVCRAMPALRRRYEKKHSTLGVLLRGDLFCDITGGDSFSDLYGLLRFLRGYLLKRTCQLTGKPFVLLPQTYGPFRTRLGRYLARDILKRADCIFSRDRKGLAVVSELAAASDRPRLCPDVAFILDADRPHTQQTMQIEQAQSDGRSIVGINISGLLYHGGYSGDNMFGLACDYRSLIHSLLSSCCLRFDLVLLVPHVLPVAEHGIEDDHAAASLVMEQLPPSERKKTLLLDPVYNQNETKYLIGLCAFFIGSRMHATIAALSQGIPTIGLAYSDKFAGVFDTVGVGACVIDLRQNDEQHSLQKIDAIALERDSWAAVLRDSISPAQNMVMSIFNTSLLPE